MNETINNSIQVISGAVSTPVPQNSLMNNPILWQALGYFVAFLLCLIIISVIQRGFFWRWFRVFSSRGRLILVKVRGVNIDHYSVGKTDKEFLKFKIGKSELIVGIKDRTVFYRSIGVLMVDYDESRGALIKPDFNAVSGYDAELHHSLYKRALYKPQITDNKQMLLALGIIIAIIGIAAVGYMLYKQGQLLQVIQGQLQNIETIQAVTPK